MSIELPDPARQLADAPTYAVLSTLNPDGGPQSSIVWIKRDGDELMFSTIRGRRKTRNLERDPRVSVLLYDPANPFSYAEVRGEVSLHEAGGRELIDELSMKYNGTSYPQEPEGTVRVVCRVRASRVVIRG